MANCGFAGLLRLSSFVYLYGLEISACFLKGNAQGRIVHKRFSHTQTYLLLFRLRKRLPGAEREAGEMTRIPGGVQA